MGVIDEFVGSKRVEDCFRESRKSESPENLKVRGLIVPHAGYFYSGSVAAGGYRLLSDQLSITPCLPAGRNYELVKIIGFHHGFAEEHSVKVQIPLIEYVLGDIEIEEIYADEVLDLKIDQQTLVVASSDLSHYLEQGEAEEHDRRTIAAILSRSEERIGREADACGLRPILTINRLANKYGWKAELIDYRTSGEVTGDYNSVVGYASIGYF